MTIDFDIKEIKEFIEEFQVYEFLFEDKEKAILNGLIVKYEPLEILKTEHKNLSVIKHEPYDLIFSLEELSTVEKLSEKLKIINFNIINLTHDKLTEIHENIAMDYIRYKNNFPRTWTKF